ncbi:BTB/POZ domain-containing protein 6-B-like [Ischnura elegans]|uniref:BTB/POZ domain-containing protein 6-B-like n=1 Tax=Ischnura elegans TaxID=197161 RepID=UPI001ED88A6E|nr:BTB/POZ domain-containing protein 6-B-like [Ischnura elegans]
MGTPCDWQVKKQKVAERGRYLLETSQWSDCKFIVGTEPHQESFQCHKLFLAIASPVFEAMFFGGMAEKDVPIPILDVQPEAFRALLEYIYTDGINLQSFDQACELCYAAKKYMLPYLVEECTNFLWRDLHSKNACRAYEFAKLFEEPRLMEKCLQIMCSETQAVISDPSFEEAEHSTLISLLEQENLNLPSELQLFEAVTRWAGRECQRRNLVPSGENLRTVLGPEPLRLLRLLTLSPAQLGSGPAVSPLLTRDEAFALLLEASAPGVADLPEGLCTSRVSRCHNDRRGSWGVRLANYYSSSRPSAFGSVSPPLEAPENVLMPMGRRLSPSTCWRNIIPDRPYFHPNSSMESSVTFTVSRNICVLGVLVPSQVSERHHVGDSGPSTSNEHHVSESSFRPSEFSNTPMLLTDGSPGMFPSSLRPNPSGPKNDGPGGGLPAATGGNHEGMGNESNVRGRMGGASGEYTELLYAHLTDGDGCRLTYTHLSARVLPDSMVEILFNRPVPITRARTYKIVVVFNRTGWYPMGECAKHVQCDDVLFNFCVGDSGSCVRDGLIRSIIFT